MDAATSTKDRQTLLYRAAADFFYLQNRHYPRKASLLIVGNRYQLHEGERQLLHRGVFGQHWILARRAKRCMGSDWQDQKLVVDGHNVQITVESAILGRPLLLANDGALRDTAGESYRFRLTETSQFASYAILRFVFQYPPRDILFLFDAPMSHSGDLAHHYREQLGRLGIVGDARTAPVPEQEFPYQGCVIASSDHAVLDNTVHWLDLAHRVIKTLDSYKLAADFSPFLLTCSTAPYSPL